MKKINKTIIVIVFIIALGALALQQSMQAQTVVYPSAVKDSDYDGLTDQGEIQIFKTNPLNPDTDGDGYLDGAEILAGTNPLDQKNTISTSTGSTAASVSTKQTPSSWPWYVTRSSAIAGYLLLFLLIVSGILIKTSIMFRLISPTTAWINHRLIGYALSLAVIIHIVSLYFDQYTKFTISNLLIPFSSNYKPLYLSMGIIGFYLLIITIISSIYIIDKYPKTWRYLHYLTYPIFLLIAIHGFFIGTDSSTMLMKATYAGTGAIVALLVMYRIYFQIKQI